MKIEISTLKNGLRLVTEQRDELETVALGIWVDCGARHETPEINGVSHLLEHMVFKGTQTRSARDIAEAIENVGGTMNAYTSREMTAFHARVLKEDTSLALDLLADVLTNSVFDPVELEREKGVVVQEIRQCQDTPDDIVFDYFQEAVFPDHPLGRPVLGTEPRVTDLNREDMIGYMNRGYTPGDMVVVAVGNLKHEDIRAQVETLLGERPSSAAHPPPPAEYIGGYRRETRPLEQMHLVAGFGGVAFTDPDYYAMAVLSVLAGGGMSSRLFQEIREKRGLAYAVYAFSANYRDTGLFGIYAGTGLEDVKELIPVLGHEIAALPRTLTEEEVRRARTQVKAGLLMSLEHPAARCEQLARQMIIFGRPLEISEMSSRLDSLTPEILSRVAERLLSSPPTLAILGPESTSDFFGTFQTSLAA